MPIMKIMRRIFQPRRTEMINAGANIVKRSEEHTSELQSHSELVCRLLLEKKKKKKQNKKKKKKKKNTFE